MITLLTKWFVKDYQNIEDEKVRRSYGVLCSIAGIFFNILLFLGKYTAGVLSGSIAITADAFNNLSDSGSSFITLIGFRMAGKRADQNHPFGHGRMEYISALIVSFLIIMMGIELLKSSIDKILHPEPVSTGLLTTVILIVSILVKLYMAVYNRGIGNKIDSSAMKATAVDSISDMAATTFVLLSTFIMKLFHLNVDGWSGLLVAVFILWAGYNAAKDTLDPLLGQAPKPELVDQIGKLVMAHPEIYGIHDLIIHDYGPGRLIISLHGEVSGDENIFVLHDAIDRIEKELEEKLGCQAVIHMDPIALNDEHVNTMKKQLKEAVKQIDPELTIHDFRVVTGTTHTNVIFDSVLPAGIKMTDSELKKELEALVKTLWGENYHAVVKIDTAYVL